MESRGGLMYSIMSIEYRQGLDFLVVTVEEKNLALL